MNFSCIFRLHHQFINIFKALWRLTCKHFFHFTLSHHVHNWNSIIFKLQLKVSLLLFYDFLIFLAHLRYLRTNIEIMLPFHAFFFLFKLLNSATKMKDHFIELFIVFFLQFDGIIHLPNFINKMIDILLKFFIFALNIFEFLFFMISLYLKCM